MTEWLTTDLHEVENLAGRIQTAEAEAMGQRIPAAKCIFVAGQGRSGLVMKMWTLRLVRLGLSVFVAGDATTPAIKAGDLLIVGLGSGETPAALAAATRAKQVGAGVAALTSRPQSTVGRVADSILFVPGETTKVNMQQASTLPLRTVLEQTMLVLLDLMVAWLAEQMGQTNETMMARHADLE